MKIFSKFEDFLYEAQKMGQKEREFILDEMAEGLEDEYSDDYFEDYEEELTEGFDYYGEEINEFFKKLDPGFLDELKKKGMGWSDFNKKADEKLLTSTSSNAIMKSWLWTRSKDKNEVERRYKALRSQKANAAASFQKQKDFNAMAAYLKKPIPGGPAKGISVSVLIIANLCDTLQTLRRANKPLFEALGGDKGLNAAKSFVATRFRPGLKMGKPAAGGETKPAAAGETKPAAGGETKPAAGGETKPAEAGGETKTEAPKAVAV